MEINIESSDDNMSDHEAAIRIAFALNKPIIAQWDAVAEACLLPLDYPSSLANAPADSECERWAQDPQLADEQCRDQGVIRQAPY